MKGSVAIERDIGSAGLVESIECLADLEIEAGMMRVVGRSLMRAGRHSLLKIAHRTEMGLAVHTVKKLAIRRPVMLAVLALVNRK